MIKLIIMVTHKLWRSTYTLHSTDYSKLKLK